MDLMEYKAKELFKESEIPVTPWLTISSVQELEDKEDCISYPVVIKAQVQTGGRGKLGGIKFADNLQELKQAVSSIVGMDIKGHIVSKVMIAPKIEISRELYLSIMLDRNSKKYMILFSSCGGMDIEHVAKDMPEKIFRLEIDPILGLSVSDAIYLGDKADLTSDQKKQFSIILLKVYAMCKKKDCMLVEINPLIIDATGNLLALDAKVSIDDSALARLPDIMKYKASLSIHPLIQEAAQYNFLYIPCDASGSVVVLSNGSGMLMSCIDHITERGMRVSAVLDLGGGATAERITEAVCILLKTNNAQILFINIFGGITRCDEVAKGIREAIDEYKIILPIVVRFEGTNKDCGLEIIRGIDNVVYVDGLLSGVEEIVKRGNVL